MANARTGKVPNPAIRGGAAKKRKPVDGKVSRPVRLDDPPPPWRTASWCRRSSTPVASRPTASVP